MTLVYIHTGTHTQTLPSIVLAPPKKLFLILKVFF